MKLDGASVVVTGAGRGLGRAIALDLAAQGARLALLDVMESHLERTADECQAEGAAGVETALCDVTNEAEVEHTFAHIAASHGGIDALVNNAGILRDGLLVKARDGEVSDKLSLDKWRSVLEVNLTGVFLCGREAAVQMIRHRNAGCIVNISSISRAGSFGQSNYAAAKAGVVALTVTWARELARHGIRCMALAPGFIDTDMTAGMPPEALQRALAQVPLGRPGRPAEVAASVTHILRNDYLNGRVIELDGGMRV